MKPIIETEKGWTEAIIDNDCEFTKFYSVAECLSSEFNLVFYNKLKDLDTIFWDFKYKSCDLVLNYNIYIGISIFPKAFKLASQTDNEAVVEIASLLLQKLNNHNWSAFENGMTIGTKGSERGIIILDIEHSNGARVTLEKECGNIPFAITLGIYGLMFHTHFESDNKQAYEYVELKKNQINKVFELYDIAEEKRDSYWDDKHHKLMHILADMQELPVDENQKK